MSYDVWLETNDPEPAEYGLPYQLNYTYNMWRMWKEAGLSSLNNLDSMEAGYVAGGLAEVVARLEGDPDHFRTFNPANGWGNYEGGLEFLRSIVKMCKDHPRAILRVG